MLSLSKHLRFLGLFVLIPFVLSLSKHLQSQGPPVSKAPFMRAPFVLSLSKHCLFEGPFVPTPFMLSLSKHCQPRPRQTPRTQRWSDRQALRPNARCATMSA
ncbi:MAG: hypothetical protein JWQ88_26 [Rhodoferax sp.]|nr:hypothetical protein [Rhodoferax sp.]